MAQQVSILRVVKAQGQLIIFFDDGNVLTFGSQQELRAFALTMGQAQLHATLLQSLVARAIDDATPAQLQGRSVTVDFASLNPVSVT